MRTQIAILFAAMLLLGCESSPKQEAAISRDFKPGGGGLAYAQVVKRFYLQAWQPADVTTTNANVQSFTRVSVVIAKDGSVVSAKIVKPSEDEQMDKSVQTVLDKIKCVQPFESGAKDERRVFTINFVENEEIAPMPLK
jgi:TonB family protein